MKKFKTSAEKRQLQEDSLSQLLVEKNLLRNVFVNYAQVPLGLALALLMLGVSWLSGIRLIQLENVLFAYFAISATALFYMLQGWSLFGRHRAQLAQTRNHFVGSLTYPMLFGGLMLFVGAMLGPKPALLALGLTLLALGTHRFGDKLPGQIGRLLPALYLTLTLGLPLLLPQGQPTLEALGLIAVSAVVLVSLALRTGRLQQPGSSEKRPTAKHDAPRQNLIK